jgi:hypothetical protein
LGKLDLRSFEHNVTLKCCLLNNTRIHCNVLWLPVFGEEQCYKKLNATLNKVADLEIFGKLIKKMIKAIVLTLLIAAVLLVSVEAFTMGNFKLGGRKSSSGGKSKPKRQSGGFGSKARNFASSGKVSVL